MGGAKDIKIVFEDSLGKTNLNISFNFSHLTD